MSTGYTAKLMEQGQSFPDFALLCARAFGHLIHMRDDPMDAEIPQKFQPSDYYAKQVIEAQKTVERLEGFNMEQRLESGQDHKQKAMDGLHESIERVANENKRLDEMEAQVKAWKPPTDQHHNLKKFMLEQLKSSRVSAKYFQESAKAIKAKAPLEYFNEWLESAKRSVERFKESDRKEQQAVKDRNEWVGQLRDSLKEQTQ